MSGDVKRPAGLTGRYARCWRRATPTPNSLHERTGAGKVHGGGLRGTAVKPRLADARRSLLSGIEGEGESLIREDAVRTPRDELPAPGLPARAQVRDGELHLYVVEVFPIRSLNERHVRCHTVTCLLADEKICAGTTGWRNPSAGMLLQSPTRRTEQS